MTNDLIILHRCLCELAKQIGFQEQAQDAFVLQQQLSTFRHVVSNKEKTQNPFNNLLHFSSRKLFGGTSNSRDRSRWPS